MNSWYMRANWTLPDRGCLQLQLGHEREAAICLMQKYIDCEAQNQPMLIKSAVALDHLKGYLYIESDKEAYVRQVFPSSLMKILPQGGPSRRGIVLTDDSFEIVIKLSMIWMVGCCIAHFSFFSR